MNSRTRSYNFRLTPVDNQRLATLCGQFDEHLRQVERHLGVKIHNRGHNFEVSGTTETAVRTATAVLNGLYIETQSQQTLTSDKVHLYLQTTKPAKTAKSMVSQDHTIIHTPCLAVKAMNSNQQKYVENIAKHDLNFGIGPAGTGKTYLAVACAISALEKERIRRILLVRPAVEAGERLGFLPGDLTQKIDPYLRPLYDALYEMLGFERVTKLVERHIIEVAPLAYMRGRTLNDSFIILDESQNTTREQMKMFLTRIGFNSIAVITGDVTQIDLPKGTLSGLNHALDVLKDVKDISITQFQSKDVVRHPLVQAIVNAYDRHEEKNKR